MALSFLQTEVIVVFFFCNFKMGTFWFPAFQRYPSVHHHLKCDLEGGFSIPRNHIWQLQLQTKSALGRTDVYWVPPCWMQIMCVDTFSQREILGRFPQMLLGIIYLQRVQQWRFLSYTLDTWISLAAVVLECMLLFFFFCLSRGSNLNRNFMACFFYAAVFFPL